MASASFYLQHKDAKKRKPFNKLTNKQLAVFLLHLAGFTQEEILYLKIAHSRNTIKKYIAVAYEYYEE